ncbi:TPA: DUF551 domain-containing protein, partial [Klebsiella pneumoniae subsp. pneumoniae]|nr:DUF551 domain-containing protein [Klebsiella pneumoniae subsp. pneumoniae]HDU4959890.1 DUF551 domain-containing protein [Klebsiella pneumoniae subsp. pneumoniae]
YDDPIELAKAIRKGPDMPPVQPVTDSEPVIVVGDDGGDALSYRRLIQSFEPGTKLYRHAQPAPVVPELRVDWQENEFSAGWNACRAAMLQELKKSAGTEAICRSDENVQVLHTKSPAQSDCCPAQNHVSPEQNGDTPAQSQGWIQVSEQMPEAEGHYLVWTNASRIDGYCDHLAIATYQGGGWSNEFNWLVTHWMPLPAGPQEVNYG